MTIKLTLQGGLIYLTLCFFVATAIAAWRRWRLGAQAFWGAGFVAAVASVTWRGLHTGHPPMQNLFEFFLCMAAALWPLSMWSRWYHRLNTTLQDALLGMLILIPAGFVLGEEIRRLPPALQSPLFVPHVGAYVAGYVLMARAALMALPLAKKSTPRATIQQADRASRQTASVGFVLLTLGLLLGSIWGKVCWSHYWQFDPKETWSQATWLLYAGYFHYRLATGLRRPRTLALLLWLGLLFIILTLTWINLSRLFSGMHNYA